MIIITKCCGKGDLLLKAIKCIYVCLQIILMVLVCSVYSGRDRHQ